jgi:hypothetical protein
MDMKSQIYSAYVEGMCPLHMLMNQGPDSHRRIQTAPTDDKTPTDLPRAPSRPRRTLLLLLILWIAVGAWQLLSRTEERRAAVVSAQDVASRKSTLLFVLIVGLTIGAGELLSHVDKARAADVPAKASASENRVP